jgi:hypothetical protein
MTVLAVALYRLDRHRRLGIVLLYILACVILAVTVLSTVAGVGV